MNPLMKNAPQIAYIESEPDLRSVITGTLQRHGFAVSVYETSKSFLPDFEVGLFDLIYSLVLTPQRLVRALNYSDKSGKLILDKNTSLGLHVCCVAIYFRRSFLIAIVSSSSILSLWVLLSARLRSIEGPKHEPSGNWN